MTPIQSAQEYVDSGCDPASKAHIEALIAECERLERLHDKYKASFYMIAVAASDLIANEDRAVSCGAHRYQKGSPTDLLWRDLKSAMLAARKEQS